MKGYDILKSLNHIDEKHIINNETTKEKTKFKVFIPIMSAAMLVGAVFLTSNILELQEENLLGQSNQLVEDVITEEYSLIFNENPNSEGITTDIGSPGIGFSEDISKEQAQKLFPILANNYDIKGRMMYYHYEEDTEIYVFQNVAYFSPDTNKNENNIVITFAENEIVNCMVTPVEEDKTTIINGVEVHSYKSHYNKYYYLASFKIDNIYYEVEYNSEIEVDELFTDVVVDIILGGKADWSTFNPEIPEKPIINEYKTLGDIATVPELGQYMFSLENYGYEFDKGTHIYTSTTATLTIEWITSTGEDYHLPTSLSISSINGDEDFSHVQNLIKIDDLTPELLQNSVYTYEKKGLDIPYFFHASIIYDDIQVGITINDYNKINTDYIYNELIKIKEKI